MGTCGVGTRIVSGPEQPRKQCFRKEEKPETRFPKNACLIFASQSCLSRIRISGLPHEHGCSSRLSCSIRSVIFYLPGKVPLLHSTEVELLRALLTPPTPITTTREAVRHRRVESATLRLGREHLPQWGTQGCRAKRQSGQPRRHRATATPERIMASVSIQTSLPT